MRNPNRITAADLPRNAFLAHCSDDDRAAIAEAAAPFTLSSQWAFLREGTPADSCYVLLDGAVGVFKGRQRVAVLGPGELVGEMAFFGGRRRATVASTGRLRGLRLDYESLTTLVASRPEVAEAVHAVYLSRLAHASPVFGLGGRPGSPVRDRTPTDAAKGMARCAPYPNPSARCMSIADRS